MEKPGLEPPPPAFPNKGLIEAGPAPCHAGARCWEPVVPRWGGRAVLGRRGATTVRSARWAAAIAEPPPVSSPLSGCRLGSLSCSGVVGTSWGLRAMGAGTGSPGTGQLSWQGSNMGFLMHQLSWETLAIPPQTRGEWLHPEQRCGGPGCGEWPGGARPWSGTAPAPHEPLCWEKAGLALALHWGHSSPHCLIHREWG